MFLLHYLVFKEPLTADHHRSSCQILPTGCRYQALQHDVANLAWCHALYAFEIGGA